MNENFEVITFDCYGTLIDWEGGITTAFQCEAARDGVALDAGQIIAAYMAAEPEVESSGYRSYREVLWETARRVAAQIAWPITQDRARFLAESIADWRPFPDTNAALERLARRFQLGILSNVDDDMLAATRKHFTVAFDPVVTAQQVKSYKPGFAHFEEARKRMGEKRHLHAAQSYFHDVVPSRKLDIPVAWVNRKNELIPEQGLRPDYEVKNLEELADLLGA